MRQPVYFTLSWCLQRGTLNSTTPEPLSAHNLSTFIHSKSVHLTFTYSSMLCTCLLVQWQFMIWHLIGLFLHVHVGRPLTAFLFQLGVTLGCSTVSAPIWSSRSLSPPLLSCSCYMQFIYSSPQSQALSRGHSWYTLRKLQKNLQTTQLISNIL